MKTNDFIPIFYACDDAFVKYTIVSIESLIDNASKDYMYHIYVLNTNISDDMRDRLVDLSNDNFEIELVDVSRYLDSISHKFPIRDYYSKTTYFRLFIAEIFNGFEKALYIDSDTVVLGDVSELYNMDVSNHLVGACHEQVMIQIDEYGTYVEKVLGISRYQFFNAGMLLINCEEFRKQNVMVQFINLLHEYDFIVTQDEDYLNVICKDQVLWIPQNWNTEVIGNIEYSESEFKIIHYIMTSKPWHYEDCRYKDHFWKYAKRTSVYESILDVLKNYTDDKKENDKKSTKRLLKMAVDETHREDNFQKRINKRFAI